MEKDKKILLDCLRVRDFSSQEYVFFTFIYLFTYCIFDWGLVQHGFAPWCVKVGRGGICPAMGQYGVKIEMQLYILFYNYIFPFFQITFSSCQYPKTFDPKLSCSVITPSLGTTIGRDISDALKGCKVAKLESLWNQKLGGFFRSPDSTIMILRCTNDRRRGSTLKCSMVLCYKIIRVCFRFKMVFRSEYFSEYSE